MFVASNIEKFLYFLSGCHSGWRRFLPKLFLRKCLDLFPAPQSKAENSSSRASMCSSGRGCVEHDWAEERHMELWVVPGSREKRGWQRSRGGSCKALSSCRQGRQKWLSWLKTRRKILGWRSTEGLGKVRKGIGSEPRTLTEMICWGGWSLLSFVMAFSPTPEAIQTIVTIKSFQMTFLRKAALLSFSETQGQDPPQAACSLLCPTWQPKWVHCQQEGCANGGMSWGQMASMEHCYWDAKILVGRKLLVSHLQAELPIPFPSANSASVPWWQFWSPFKEALPESEQVWLAEHCPVGLRKSLCQPLPTYCPKNTGERLKLCQLWQCPKEKAVRGKMMRIVLVLECTSGTRWVKKAICK